MNIFRAYNPDIAKLIYKDIPLSDTHDRIIDGMELFDRMTDYPENTCVIICADGVTLKGFIYGWTVSNRDFVWCQCAWADKSIGQENVDIVVEMFFTWIKSKGYKRVQMMTKRPKGFMRKYGFSQYAVVMERILE